MAEIDGKAILKRCLERIEADSEMSSGAASQDIEYQYMITADVLTLALQLQIAAVLRGDKDAWTRDYIREAVKLIRDNRVKIPSMLPRPKRSS